MAEATNMIRIPVDSVMLHHWSQQRGFNDIDHATHCMLTETFKEMAPRPFRMFLPTKTKRAQMLGYTTHSAADLKEAAKLNATQIVQRTMDIENIQHKPVPTDWQEGEIINFQVRLCPSRRALKHNVDYSQLANTANPPNEQDAYLNHLAICRENDLTPKGRQEVYVEWLNERITKHSGGHLQVGTCQLLSYNKLQAQRRLNGPVYYLAETTIAGSIAVTDPEEFQKLIANGVGRHKAYGFGMVLINSRS